jgi:hypothetical protein
MSGDAQPPGNGPNIAGGDAPDAVPDLDEVPRPDVAAAGTATQRAPTALSVSVEQRREGARLAIALILLGLLAVLTLTALSALLANLINSSELKDVATALITPVVALVGAATGFYYGGRTS